MILAPGETALHDALALALPVAPVPGRRQVAVLLSAGPDTTSFLDASAALDITRRSSAVIFVVGSTVDPNPLAGSASESATPNFRRDFLAGSRRLPEAFLQRIASETGGRVEIVEPGVYLANSPTQIHFRRTGDGSRVDDAFLRAIDAFRASYIVRYTPAGVAPDGWHDLVVRVVKRGRYDVTARRGYWRQAPQAPSQ